MNRRFITLIAAFLSAAAISADQWNDAMSFAAWKANKNVQCAIAGNSLKLHSIGVDCSIVVRDLKLNSADYSGFSYTYRAVKSSSKRGQIFYAGEDGRFTAKNIITLPYLVPDGKKRTVTVDFNKLPAAEKAAWANAGTINNLRFDPTDGAGGEIEIYELKLIKKNAGAKASAVVPAKAPATTWNAGNGFQDWNQASRAKITKANGCLVWTIQKRDSYILNSNVDIVPAECAAFSYTYRAKGVNPADSGQLFFAAANERFIDAKRISLPGLRSDNQWHTEVIDLAKIRPNELKLWQGLAKVQKLRLDITDSATGVIELKEFKFIMLPKRSSDIVWNQANKFANWNKPVKLTKTITADGLKLVIQKRDSQLINDNVSIDPKNIVSVTYRYRATGLEPGQKGQIFYGVDGKGFVHNQMWKLPELIADGAWHTVTVTKAQISNPAAWFNAKKITSLRLDITDSATGTVEISEIKFNTAPSTARIYRNENLDADQWKPVTPDFQPKKQPVVPGIYYTAVPISAPEDLQPHEVQARLKPTYFDFFLRKEFELRSKPAKAYLQFMADDNGQAFFNGKQAGFCKTWYTPTVTEVTNLLKQGKNVWGFHYRNGGNVGCVFGELFIEYADGSYERINTDDKFVSTVIPPDDWNLASCDTAKFKKVITLARPPAAPWIQKIAYNNYAASQKLIKKNVSPAKTFGGKQVKLQMEFTGRMPDVPFFGDVKITRNGFTQWEENIKIEASSVKKLANNRWQLNIDYTLPLYITTSNAKISFESGSIYLAGNEKIESDISIEQVKSIPDFTKKVITKVQRGPYGPYFEFNGKPFYYISSNMGAFIYGNPPTNTVSVGSDSYNWWNSQDKYDFEIFDYCAERARREQGDCYFVWNLTMFIPREVLKKYPGATCLDEKGNIVRDGYPSKLDSHAFASQEVLKEMQIAVTKAIEYLEKSPYANRIIGYRINGGHTIEWLGWQQKGGVVDFSEASKKGFARFAKVHYPELKDYSIPSAAARRALDNGEIIWDPQKHLNAIAFNEYYSTAICEYVIGMCQAAKKALNNQKLVGTYFGYTMTLNSTGSSQMRGHYALKKLLDSRSLDFLMSPQPYNVRNIGDTYGDMKPFTSIQNYNIVSLQEDDTRTHLSAGGMGYYQSLNAEMTTNILRRGMGFTLCRNMPTRNIALPGHYDYPQAHIDYPVLEKVGQHCLEKQVKRNAEIALVVSEKSICYSPELRKGMYTGKFTQAYTVDGSPRAYKSYGAPFAHTSFGENYTTWARLGAPADYLLAEDLADNPGDYKLYVFINCQVYDKKFQQAIAKLQKKNCTLLWLYAPGFTTGNKNSLANMKALTGLDLVKAASPMYPAATMNDNRVMGSQSALIAPLFAVNMPQAEVMGKYTDGSTAVAAVKTSKATTVFSGTWAIDLAFCRDIAKRAGVRIYCESGDPLEANESLVALHSRFAGKKTVKLPVKTNVLDVFNKKIIARNVDKFSVNVKLHESPLFYYGDDADELLKKLLMKK